MATRNDIPPFAAHVLATLALPPPSIDPAAQARECATRAREFLRTARLAREIGTRKQYADYLRAARMMKFAANQWRERARQVAP